MSAQEYVVRSVKKAGTNKGAYGEYQNYALAVVGIGEPIKLSLPEPIFEDPEAGDHLYGRLTERKGAGNQLYYELKLEPRTAADLKDLDIHAQVALKLAIEVWLSQGADPDGYKNIEKEAVHFGRMINIIKQELK